MTRTKNKPYHVVMMVVDTHQAHGETETLSDLQRIPEQPLEQQFLPPLLVGLLSLPVLITTNQH
jgi:hypothetical protein